MQTFVKIYTTNPNLVKIEYKYRSLYVLPATLNHHKITLRIKALRLPEEVHTLRERATYYIIYSTLPSLFIAFRD
jgi:hypothetical protein